MIPEQMTGLERIEALEERMLNVEQAIATLRQTWQELVKQELATISVEAIHRIVQRVEAEWTGSFLPELRRTIRADVKETLESGGTNV